MAKETEKYEEKFSEYLEGFSDPTQAKFFSDSFDTFDKLFEDFSVTESFDVLKDKAGKDVSARDWSYPKHEAIHAATIEKGIKFRYADSVAASYESFATSSRDIISVIQQTNKAFTPPQNEG